MPHQATSHNSQAMAQPQALETLEILELLEQLELPAPTRVELLTLRPVELMDQDQDQGQDQELVYLDLEHMELELD